MNSRKILNILLIDDSFISGLGIQNIFEKRGSRCNLVQVHSYEKAIQHLNAYQFDLIIGEILIASQPTFDQFFNFMKSNNVVTPTVVFSGIINRLQVQKCLETNFISSIVSKLDNEFDLWAGIKLALSGQGFFSPKIHSMITPAGQYDMEPTPTLSKREEEILSCIGRGQTRKHIAEHLLISVRTVDRHRQNIMDKLNLHHEIELAHYAVTEGYSTLSITRGFPSKLQATN